MRRLLPTLLAFSLGLSPAFAEKKQPNIVFILADDMGWMDTGYNGNLFYETPNIDRLAKDGLTFDRAYAGGPNCSPTRACLLSGMYGPRTHIWTPGAASKGIFHRMKLLVPNRSNKKGRTFPNRQDLDPSVTSLAEILKPAGYATARFGKWHLGPDDFQGFDLNSYSGNLKNDYQSGKKGYRDTRNAQKITDAGINFIEANTSTPFFLFLSHFEPHVPLVADPKVVQKYKDKLASKKWSHPWNPTYAAMLEALDHSVGRIQKKLTELGLAENTLLIFSSDNGGVTPVTPMAPLKGAKGCLSEGGIRVPTVMTWPGVIQPGTRTDTPITSVDFLPTFAELAEAKLPDSQPVDGTSFTPLLKGKELPERAIYWHYPFYLRGNGPPDRIIPALGTDELYWCATPCSVICRGDWKLIQYFDTGHLELHNLKEDPSEKTDLSEKFPDKVTALKQELTAWQKKVAAPIPTEINPNFEGK